MKKIFFLLVLLTLTLVSTSQNNWTQRANFGGVKREGGMAFSIGTKGYLGFGHLGANVAQNDLWEYDPSTNTWTQKASAVNQRRWGVGFSIGNFGYVGLGCGSGGSPTIYVSFERYDPSTNTWSGIANFPALGRNYAVGFSIGNKGYVGTGGNSAYNDFWEYDPATNTWVQKANVGGNPRDGAVGWSIGNKGYIATGNDAQPGWLNDLWEYNPGTNTWIQKASVPTLGRDFASGFSIGSKGYLGIGRYNGSGLINDFWEYDQATDTWTQRANYSGGAVYFGCAFAIGTKGYFGIGYKTPLNDMIRDFWEYSPYVALSASYSQSNPLCNGQCTGTATVSPSGGTIPYTYSWNTIPSQTTSTATGLCAGTYTCTVTDASSATLTVIVTITQPTVISASASASTSSFCTGGCTNLSINASGGTPGYTYLWMPGSLTSSSPNVCPTTTTTYTCIVTDANACTRTATVTVTVNALPNVTLSAANTTTCVQWTSNALTGTPPGGTYSGPGVTTGNFNPSLAGTGNWYAVYTYTDGNGCTRADSVLITVGLCTDVNSTEVTKEVVIYPNPCSSQLIITSDVERSITLVDLLGEIVGEIKLLKGMNVVDITKIPNGVYFIQFVSHSDIKTEKIIKN